MNVVLDTNVVVSGAINPHGMCGRILDLLLQGSFKLCVDDRILHEYQEVLDRPELRIEREATLALMAWVRYIAQPIAAPLLRTPLPDPDDLPFLEVASAAGALLVTGNRRHFPVPASAGVRVLSPTDFVAILRATTA
jgi:putative PIN family toxin of toxin-antitoxin system